VVAASVDNSPLSQLGNSYGVSMTPDELKDMRELEQLTGVGFSELYHRHLAPRVHTALALLRDARAAGMELDRARLRDHWDLHADPAQLAALYAEKSELALGD
jgi:predicted dehydrogenase